WISDWWSSDLGGAGGEALMAGRTAGSIARRPAIVDPGAVTGLEARAFWVTGPGRGELRSETIAAPGPDEVLVEARFGAVSRGTESLVFHGRVPPSEHERM